MRRTIASMLSVALVATGLAVAPRVAQAWKPPTHLFGVDGALNDAKDGTVTIPRTDGASSVNVGVHPKIVQALNQFPNAYYAGAIGPDAFPDTYFGQAMIHPDTKTKNDTVPPQGGDVSQSFEWMGYLWEQAWNPATPEPARLENIAFALGYMGGHAQGDMWSHTIVNKYAEGVFPDFTDLEHADISVRHLVLETYIDKHRPGYESNTAFPIDAPIGFIADTLILSDFARAHGDHPLIDFFLDMRDGLTAEEASVHHDSTHQDFLGDCPFCVPDPTDSPLNVIELALDLLIEEYLENWIEDITTGLRAWPEVWQTIAIELMSGKKPNSTAIFDALKEWALLHFLSMMGLPDIIGEGIFLISEIVSFITGIITTVLKAIFDAIKAIPVIGDVVEFVEDLYKEAKAFIVGKLTEIVDYLAGIFLTLALGFSNLHPDVKKVFDKDNDGIIKPSEVIRVFVESEEYMNDPDLFPPGTRSAVDADMALPAGCVDDDAGEQFCDYNLTQFAPLYDTQVMGKISMLDENGLNTFFKQAAGGNTSALGNLYGAHTNASGAWTVPNNAMLGWMKSMDAEYQWRTNSPNDNHSYGTGAMRLWEDCVSRSKVFRPTFKNPVSGIDGFTDAGDPPTGLSDSTAPTSSLSLSGPNVTNNGQTFVSGETDIAITSLDNYFEKANIHVFVRNFATGQTPPAYGPPVVADPAPFQLGDEDGSKTVQYYAVDDDGKCNTEAEQTQQFSLDNTPPVITVISPVPPQTDYESDEMLLLNFTADDGAGSGVDPETARHYADGVEQTPVPTQIDLFDYPAGIHEYKAQQADLLGNLGETIVPWRTIVTHESLQNNLDKAYVIRACIKDFATYHSLRVKLVNAEAADGRGQDGSSDNQLESFKNEIAMRQGEFTEPGKTITPYCGNILTINATALQAA